MTKCVCASIISLRRLKPCTRNNIQRRILSSCTLPLFWSLVCTFRHTDIRYRLLLLFVVVQYDLKNYKLNVLWMSVCYSMSLFPDFILKVHSSSVTPTCSFKIFLCLQ